MSNICYTGTEDQVTIANNQINTNCGFPNNDAQNWDTPTPAYTPNTFWFIRKPPPGGLVYADRTYTQEEMINGVVNVIEQPYSPSWRPPP